MTPDLCCLQTRGLERTWGGGINLVFSRFAVDLYILAGFVRRKMLKLTIFKSKEGMHKVTRHTVHWFDETGKTRNSMVTV